MKRPNVRVTVDKNQVKFHVLTHGTLIEIRDYDVDQTNGNARRRCTDDAGRQYQPSFIELDGEHDTEKTVKSDLERFTKDLVTHTGVKATLEPATCADGLHTLRINNVDYFFCGDGGYDGWGREIVPGGSE